MRFFEGQRVRCIDVTPSPGGRVPHELAVNALYTIARSYDHFGLEALDLVEVPLRPDRLHVAAFDARRFEAA